MTLIIRQMALAVLGLLLVSGSYVLQVRLDQLQGDAPKVQRFAFLPQPEVLKVASLGYHSVVGDFIWLQAIQAIAGEKLSEEAGRWIYRALDVVTTLDPHFVRAYEAGGLVLCTVVVLPNESNALLEKGMKYNPQVWTLPYYTGINYYFELGDDAKAGEYIARAARLPGAPEFLPGLAARMYVSAKAPQNAVELLASLYEHAAEGEARQVLEQRLKEAIVERDLQMLEAAIARYRDRFSSPPFQLEDLVVRGVLRVLPGDPFGGEYLYDPYIQVVSSGSVKERLTIKRHRRG